MLGRTFATIIVGFFILSHVSCMLTRRLNLSQLIKESLEPRLYHQYSLRDIPVMSYLPEEEYNAGYEVERSQLQQLDRNNRNLMPEYRNLCETITRRVEIADDDYEYQPPHYHEVFCKSYSLLSEDERMSRKPLQQKCAYPVFHCVQRSRHLFLIRRRWDSECWEPYTKEIASGCDCMWPVTTLGEITALIDIN